MSPPPGGTSAPPFTRPNPIVGNQTHDVYTKHLSGDARDIYSTPVRIVVDGKVVAPGEQTAQALALLGIDEATVDANWFAFFSEVSGPLTRSHLPDYEHQNDMGWTIDVTITAGAITEVADLAYVDPRAGERTVTYRVRQFEPATSMGPRGIGSAPPSSRIVTKTEPLEASGAIGAFYSGVSAEDIDSTRRAAVAVEAARADLERALQEIDIAVTVADAAWSGTRAEATTFRCGLEAQIIASITEVSRTWEAFMRDLVEQQRQAKDHDEQLLKEIAFELAITLLAGVVTFGFGAAVSATFVATRLARWAHEVAAVRALIKSNFAVKAGQVARTTVGAQATRILARGAGDLSARATVAGVREDKELTGQDVMISFAIAGALGQGSSEFGKVLLQQLEKRHGVKFTTAPGFGAAKGAIQGVSRGGASAIATNMSLAKVGSAYTVGIPTEALKETQKRAVSKQLVEILNSDPGARAAAVQRIQGHPEIVAGATPARTAEILDAELKAEAERMINPVMDYLYGAGGGAAVLGTASVVDGVPAAPPLPDTNGHVPPTR